jgi:hypothetical protein
MKTTVLLDCRKEDGLEVNAGRIKYTFLTCKSDAGHIWNITLTNKSLQNIPEFKYLRSILINYNFNHDYISDRCSVLCSVDLGFRARRQRVRDGEIGFVVWLPIQPA